MSEPKSSPGREGPELAAGEAAAGCLVLGYLGRGSRTDLYLASRGTRPGGQLVTLERLRPSARSDRALAARAVQAWRLATRAFHPNALRVLDVDPSGMAVHEFLGGRSLLDVAAACHRAGAFIPFTVTAHLLAECLAALHAWHEISVDTAPFHGGIIPDNIFVTYDGGVKLAGFATAAIEGQPRRGYSPPELLEQHKGDRRVDIFSAGVTLYETLAHVMPFGGVADDDVTFMTINRVPARPRSINPAVPTVLEDICMKALTHEPVQRFSSAIAMREMLVGYVRASGRTVGASHIKAFLNLLFPADSDEERLRVGRLAESAVGVRTPPPAPVATPPRAPPPLSEARTNPRAATPKRPVPIEEPGAATMLAPLPLPAADDLSGFEDETRQELPSLNAAESDDDLGFDDRTVQDLPALTDEGIPAALVQTMLIEARRDFGSASRAEWDGPTRSRITQPKAASRSNPARGR